MRCLLAAVAALAPLCASAQYPVKLIRLLNGFPPGGPTEIIARTVTQRLSVSLGQPVVIDNRVGAAGTVAAETAAKSPADGYTILLASTGMLASAPALYKKLGYDPVASFDPISLLTYAPFVVIVNASVPARSLREFIELAKSKPRELNFGSGGIGNPMHIGGEMFKLAAGVDLFHVPYKGTGPVIPDLLSGRIQVAFDVMAPYQPHLQSGKLRALAVAGQNRVPQLPDVPTTAEAGLPGYDVGAWFCLVAPKGTPADIVRRLSAETQKALATSEVKEVFAKVGLEALASTPEQLAARIRDDGAKWARAVKLSGATLE